MAANDVVGRRLQLIQFDHNWIEPTERRYQLNIEPLIGRVQQLARRLSGETRQIMVVDSDGLLRPRHQRKCRHFWPPTHGTRIHDHRSRHTHQCAFDDRKRRYSVLIAAPTSEIVGSAQQALVTLHGKPRRPRALILDCLSIRVAWLSGLRGSSRVEIVPGYP